MQSDLDLLRQLRRMDALFRRAYHSIAGARQETARRGGHGHGKILHALEQEDCMTQRQLAERLEIRPQSLTDALLRLEQEGWIVRARSERDRREQTVSITPSGRARSEELRALREQAAHKLMAGLSDSEKEQLGTLLSKIIESYKESEGESGV